MQSFKGGESGPMVCYSVTVSVDPANLAANTGAYQDVSIPAAPGCATGQRVIANPLADLSTPGYSFGDIRVSAANTVRVQTLNVTAGALNPAALDVAFVFLGNKNQP